MEMRDRLIELVRQSGCVSVWDYYNDDFVEPDPIETLADHLLANGVIVPPCKVGQTVYYISFGKVYKGKCHAVTQHKDSLQIHLYDFDGDNASYPAKAVFLTKEEAEKALKEREGNG